jgi:hypothetical protein
MTRTIHSHDDKLNLHNNGEDNMQKMILPLSALLALSISACMQTSGPYETGLTVTREAEEFRETKYYLAYEEGDAKERKGTLNQGGNCETAAASAGQLTQQQTLRTVDQFKVIGQTESNHPLVPGTDTYGTAFVSVLSHTYLTEGDTFEEESFRVPGGAPSEWQETREGEIGIVTNVSYEGVTADEYVVSLNSMGDLWEDLQTEGSDLNVTLMTRNNPAADAIWSSLNGNMLYIAAGNEEIDVGGEKVQAVKVEVYTVGDVDPAASNIVATCLAVDRSDFTTDHPDFENGSIRTAHLDPGCEAGFINQQIGTQWWHENVLVKAELVTYEVTIVDYGYEWYEIAGDTCFRVTSGTRDNANGELFVEYAVTEITQVLGTTGFTVATE